VFHTFLAEEMDQADAELRVTLKKLWPLHSKKNILDLAVPPNSSNKYSVPQRTENRVHVFSVVFRKAHDWQNVRWLANSRKLAEQKERQVHRCKRLVECLLLFLLKTR